MALILVIDNEPLLRTLDIALRARHYQVHTATDGTTALSLAGNHPPDLVIVDLVLPDMNGVDVIHALRGWSNVPIIALSDRHDEGDTIAILDAGADDYITKPFETGELLARVRAALRRAEPAGQAPIVHTTAFTVDLAARQVTRHTDTGADRKVRLTRTEWQILETLVSSPGKLISQQQLLREIWGPAHSANTNYLRVYLLQLRRKLEPDPARPRHLITEPGVGYRFET